MSHDHGGSEPRGLTDSEYWATVTVIVSDRAVTAPLRLAGAGPAARTRNLRPLGAGGLGGSSHLLIQMLAPAYPSQPSAHDQRAPGPAHHLSALQMIARSLESQAIADQTCIHFLSASLERRSTSSGPVGKSMRAHAPTGRSGARSSRG